MDKNPVLNNQLVIGEEKSQAISHKDIAIKKLDTSINQHIELAEYKQSHLLSYWIEEYSKYHNQERTFSPKTLKKYKRGDIVKVNLGYNIGAELGGLHYCIVISKNDNMSFNTLTVVPLSSIKVGKVYSFSTVDLGNELYKLLLDKYNNESEKVKMIDDDIDLLGINAFLKKIKHLEKIGEEIKRMKSGSIALLHQITTVSKQRIYNPKSKEDILSGIRLSNESMDLIDEKVKILFTK
jgi:PemK-like protein.